MIGWVEKITVFFSQLEGFFSDNDQNHGDPKTPRKATRLFPPPAAVLSAAPEMVRRGGVLFGEVGEVMALGDGVVKIPWYPAW